MPGVEEGNRILDPICASFLEKVFVKMEVQAEGLEKLI
jgi:hypothetical protein